MKMKNILSFSLFILLASTMKSQSEPSLAPSLDCSTLLKKTEDKFNERTIIQNTNSFTIRGNDMLLGIGLLSIERGYCAMTFGFGDGWVDGGEPIIFIMEDGERIKLKNTSRVNYDGRYSCTIQTYLDIPETKKAFESLTTKKMTSIKVDFFEADLTPEDSQKLLNLFTCLKSENVKN